MKNLFLVFAVFVLTCASSIGHAQSWTQTGITETGDTITYRFPPPPSTYVPNLLVLKFYNGWLDYDSLCYDCSEVHGEGRHIFGEDKPFTDCKQTLMEQKFSLNIILDPVVQGILIANGASYVMRMTAANPCTDTLSVTRREDTIPADDYNWIEVTFSNDTGLIPAIEELFTSNPSSLQLEDLVHYMHAASPPMPRHPHDSEYHVGHQKSLDMIGMTQAWGYNVGDSQIKVAVVDNGVDYRRCEFGGDGVACCIGTSYKVSGGEDFNTKTPEGVDNADLEDPSHGTACASIFAAFTNNSNCEDTLTAHFAFGMAGIAGGWGTYDDDTSTGGPGVQILAYKIDSFPLVNAYRSDWATSAIMDASDSSPNGPYGYGAHIINNSYSYDTDQIIHDSAAKYVFPALRAAAAEAYRNNVCFVASKGDAGINTDTIPNWPADFNPQKDIIAVGSSDHDTVRQAGISSFGRTTDLIAPGGLSFDTSGLEYISRAQAYGADTFYYFGQTSAAAPHVCGVLALMRGFYSGTVIPYTEDWEGMLEASVMSLQGRTDPVYGTYGLGFDTLIGWGFLRADSALEKLDPTGLDHYQLFHYTVPFAMCDTGAWDTSSRTLIIEEDGFADSLPRGTYTVFRREITGTTNYSSSIDTTKQVYTWGNGEDGFGIGGWSIASPNSQEPWSEVTNGQGGIPGSPVNIREGIWHKQSRTVTAHSFQYKVLIDSTYVIWPPDSLCGVSFSVFGSAAPSSGVAPSPIVTGNGFTVFPTIANETAHVIATASDQMSELEIANSLGVILDREHVKPQTSEIIINTTDLPEGFYFCRLISEDATETAKFIVRH